MTDKEKLATNPSGDGWIDALTGRRVICYAESVPATKCPSCQRVLTTGEEVYRCEECNKACCTACSTTTGAHPVVCDDCEPCE